LIDGCIGVVIPTYNERENIVKLLDALTHTLERLRLCYRIVVVDDNSPDGTAEAVRDYARSNSRVEVVVRPGKLGLGSAIVEGFKRLLAHPDIVLVVTMDADLSHSPEELPRLLARAREADVVQGSRYIPGGGVVGWSLYRRVVSWGANTLVRLLYRTGLRDNTGNYRVYSRRAVEDLVKYTESAGFEWVVEALLTLLALGYRVVEEPITFTNRKRGRSKLGLTTIAKWFISLLRMRSRVKRLKHRGSL